MAELMSDDDDDETLLILASSIFNICALLCNGRVEDSEKKASFHMRSRLPSLQPSLQHPLRTFCFKSVLYCTYSQ